MIVKIKCPKCDRILGDTDKSLDANLNCRGCKEAVRINVQIAQSADYLPKNFNYKEEKK